MLADPPGMDSELVPALTRLLEGAGCTSAFTISELRGGSNNRVFRVGLGDRSLLLKTYFRHPGDRRDRLATEYGFIRFAWAGGLRSIPEPIASDPGHSMALYRFVEGRPVEPGDMAPGMVDQAVEFYRELNQRRTHPDAQALPRASEACFSLAEHVDCVGRRVQKLDTLEASSSLEREARDFVRQLSARWLEVERHVIEQSRLMVLELEEELPRPEWRLTPSDFGFHNALLADGRLCFIDFEYAGWDDPAKLVCDFFCQPAVPVPKRYFAAFRDAVIDDQPDPERHRRRIALLQPVYQVKWVCIMLNDFLPLASLRRRFASPIGDSEERKTAQIKKARAALQEIKLQVE